MTKDEDGMIVRGASPFPDDKDNANDDDDDTNNGTVTKGGGVAALLSRSTTLHCHVERERMKRF